VIFQISLTEGEDNAVGWNGWVYREKPSDRKGEARKRGRRRSDSEDLKKIGGEVNIVVVDIWLSESLGTFLFHKVNRCVSLEHEPELHGGKGTEHNRHRRSNNHRTNQLNVYPDRKPPLSDLGEIQGEQQRFANPSCRQRTPQQKQQEILVIAQTNTVPYKGTVVVHAQRTPPAFDAVVAPIGLPLFALATVARCSVHLTIDAHNPRRSTGEG